MRWIGALVFVLGCNVFPSAFECSEDEECQRGFARGVCEQGGCAFEDPRCVGSLRFDESASGGRGGTCVDPPPPPPRDGGTSDTGSPPADDAGGRNACGGTEDLGALPGDVCGNCGLGRWECDGADRLVCTGDPRFDEVITHEGSPQASATFSNEFRPEFAIDTDLTTSWFSAGPEGVPSRFTISFGERQCFSRLVWNGNERHRIEQFREGFGFGQVIFRILDGDTPVFSEPVDLPGTPDENQEIILPAPTAGTAVELLLTGHEDSSCGGFSELIINGLR